MPCDSDAALGERTEGYQYIHACGVDGCFTYKAEKNVAVGTGAVTVILWTESTQWSYRHWESCTCSKLLGKTESKRKNILQIFRSLTVFRCQMLDKSFVYVMLF